MVVFEGFCGVVGEELGDMSFVFDLLGLVSNFDIFVDMSVKEIKNGCFVLVLLFGFGV